MDSTLIEQTDKGSEIAAAGRLQVLLLSEDGAAGRHARRVYETLTRPLGEEFDFDAHDWEFAALTDPHRGALATHAASVADMVIVAVHGACDLPTPVKSWFQESLPRNPNAPALVILFAGANPAWREPICAYFEQVARGGNMDFFAEPAARRLPPMQAELPLGVAGESACPRV